MKLAHEKTVVPAAAEATAVPAAVATVVDAAMAEIEAVAAIIDTILTQPFRTGDCRRSGPFFPGEVADKQETRGERRSHPGGRQGQGSAGQHPVPRRTGQWAPGDCPCRRPDAQ